MSGELVDQPTLINNRIAMLDSEMERAALISHDAARLGTISAGTGLALLAVLSPAVALTAGAIGTGGATMVLAAKSRYDNKLHALREDLKKHKDALVGRSATQHDFVALTAIENKLRALTTSSTGTFLQKVGSVFTGHIDSKGPE
jgi:multisubunit Na+/H+ antiporter MnhB subunit